MRAYLKEALSPLGLEVFTDPIGNLYAHRPGPGPRVMVAAHMDEVGMVVRGHREDGTLAYAAAGIDAGSCRASGCGWASAPMPCPESSAARPSTCRPTRNSKSASPMRRCIWTSAPAAGRKPWPRPRRAPVWFQSAPMLLGDLVCSKALDDRLGCVILLQLLQESFACDFYGVFTVQEELGTRGAMAATAQVAPQLALVLEGTTANDLPGLRPDQMVTQVGKGAAITLMDGRTLALPRMVNALFQTAKAHNIPHQPRRGARGGTDGGAIHQGLGGCPVGGISVPCRYIHSPNSLCSLGDMEAAYQLARHFLLDEMWKEVLHHAGT